MLQVNELGNNVIFTTVITRKKIGQNIFIPIINLVLSFKF